MRVLNLLCGGGIGGIEILCKEYAIRSSLDNRYLVLWEPGEISHEMMEAGVNVEIFNTCTKRYFSDFLRFIKKCKDENIDVLVCHQVAPLISLYIIGLHFLLPDIYVVSYAHSNAFDWNNKDFFCRKIVYHYARKIICVSKSVLESVENRFNNGSKLLCIYNGINTEEFMPCVKKTATCDELKMIFVGRLTKEKGVENILNGISSLPNDVNVMLTVVGDGPYREELENLCVELKISDKVKFLGIRRDIPALLSQAEIFIHLPNWREGFGITVVEAMAAGLICIVNDHGALPEIIDNAINGFVVSDENEFTFPAILKSIYQKKKDNPHSLEKIKLNAMKKAEMFSMDMYVSKMDSFLKQT